VAIVSNAGKSEETNANVIPAIESQIARLKEIVRGTKQQALFLETLEMVSIIVD
jgi:hypothetical protein